jgi:GT2 family glycosyltransferase
LSVTIPKVSIAIVAYRSRKFLPACLQGLAAQTHRDFEAVIVVNGQDDDSVNGLVLPDDRFRIVRLATNVGFAAANNYAASNSSSPWFAALNPDAVPDRTWLANLLEAAHRWPKAAAFGSTQVSLENPGVLDGAGDVWHVAGLCWRSGMGYPTDDLPAEGEVFGPCAAAALYKRDAFLAVGGFDESYFCYCEDIDLAFRLRLAGHTCVQVPSAVVLHAGSGISGKKSEFSLYHVHRNRIWTFFKDTPGVWVAVMLPFHLAANLLLLMKAVLEGAGGPVARAYVSAARGLPRVWRERRKVQATRRVPAFTVLDAMDWGTSTRSSLGVDRSTAVTAVQGKTSLPGRLHDPSLALARRRR